MRASSMPSGSGRAVRRTRRSPFSLAEVLAALAARQPALVALVGDRVVGAIAARVDGQRAWVLRWSVAPESRAARRRGRAPAALERRCSRSASGTSRCSHRRRGAEIARAAGYAQHEGVLYLEKRRLRATAGDDRVDELGGSGPRRTSGPDRRDGAREGADRAPGDPAARGAGGGAPSRRCRGIGGDPVRPARDGQDDVREGDRRTARLAVRRDLPESARRRRRARRAGALRELFEQLLYPRQRRRLHRRGRGDRRRAARSSRRRV